MVAIKLTKLFRSIGAASEQLPAHWGCSLLVLLQCTSKQEEFKRDFTDKVHTLSSGVGEQLPLTLLVLAPPSQPVCGRRDSGWAQTYPFLLAKGGFCCLQSTVLLAPE